MNRGRSYSLDGRAVWEENLRDMVESLGVARGGVSEHLTASVAMYCQQYLPHGARRSDLILLVARAYCSLNDRDSAARLLRSIKPHAHHVDRWLEILSELHHFPLLLPYFSAGIVRPADWAGALLDRMWVLDLGKLALAESERHEMMLYRSLRSIVESLVYFWDATEGEGVLGLKGLSAFNVENTSGARQTFTRPNDLLGYVEGLFRQAKDARGWDAVPDILNLDL